MGDLTLCRTCCVSIKAVCNIFIDHIFPVSSESDPQIGVTAFSSFLTEMAPSRVSVTDS